MAAPPPAARRSAEKSTSPMRGCRVRLANRVLTPVKTVQRAALRTSMKASMSRGLGTSQLWAPIEKQVRKFTVSAKMWYSGIAVTTTSPPGTRLSGEIALNCMTFAIRLRCESAAPLDRPVVPPVYCRKIRSSPVTATRSSGRFAPCASAASNPTAPSIPPCPAAPTRMTCRIAVRGITCATVAAPPPNTMMVFAPASLS